MELTTGLASGSPRRRELLTQAGYRFEVQVSSVAEIAPAGRGRHPLCHQAGSGKGGRSFCPPCSPGVVVLGADTVVVCDGEVMGKPADAADAARMLLRLSGRTHQVVTGVAVVWGDGLSRDCRGADPGHRADHLPAGSLRVCGRRRTHGQGRSVCDPGLCRKVDSTDQRLLLQCSRVAAGPGHEPAGRSRAAAGGEKSLGLTSSFFRSDLCKDHSGQDVRVVLLGGEQQLGGAEKNDGEQGKIQSGEHRVPFFAAAYFMARPPIIAASSAVLGNERIEQDRLTIGMCAFPDSSHSV